MRRKIEKRFLKVHYTSHRIIRTFLDKMTNKVHFWIKLQSTNQEISLQTGPNHVTLRKFNKTTLEMEDILKCTRKEFRQLLKSINQRGNRL